MRVALLDLGVGNLHSLCKALARHGAEVEVVTEPSAALRLPALVLPGVGAFGPAAERLAGDAGTLRRRLEGGLPCLGICLGMQLLYEESEEAPGRGIGLLRGRVRRLRAARTPQMGWNRVETGADPLFADAPDPVVYYANRYVAPAGPPGRVIAWSDYREDRFPAAVRLGNTWGTQFHPEKSGEDGLRILGAFLQAARGIVQEEP